MEKSLKIKKGFWIIGFAILINGIALLFQYINKSMGEKSIISSEINKFFFDCVCKMSMDYKYLSLNNVPANFLNLSFCMIHLFVYLSLLLFIIGIIVLFIEYLMDGKNEI